MTPLSFKRHEKCEPLQTSNPIKEANILNSIKPISESQVENEEQLNSSIRKKVTFDLKVKTHEEVSIQEATKCSAASEKEKEREKAVKEENTNQKHRYHNCTSSDDEYDSNAEDAMFVQEESSEFLFSLSIESRKQAITVETVDKEVNSPIIIGSNQNCKYRIRNAYSVLKPVENLSQWREVKVRTNPPLKDQEKENINSEQELNIPFSEEPSFKWGNNNSRQISNPLKPKDKGIAVDTSLSSWLVESERTPITKQSPSSIWNSMNSSSQKANSFRSFEDKPILGALTVEELKQFSASSSPRRSQSRSPYEKPIIVTVGSYWRHIGQAMDSDSISSCKGMLGTSSMFKKESFETRLERALDRGIA